MDFVRRSDLENFILLINVYYKCSEIIKLFKMTGLLYRVCIRMDNIRYRDEKVIFVESVIDLK